MRMGKRKKSIRLIRNESGSYSLEASLVTPVLLAVIAGAVLFAIHAYERTVRYGAASLTAERTAYLWDNSKRDIRTGLPANDEYDGLYWRFTEDRMLSSLFGVGGGNEPDAATSPIGSGYSDEGSDTNGGESLSLAERKLVRTVGHLEGIFAGENRYKRLATTRRIETSLLQRFDSSILNQWLDGTADGTDAIALVVEPDEFIRSVDLVRYYTNKFGNRNAAASQRQEAGQLLQQTVANANAAQR